MSALRCASNVFPVLDGGDLSLPAPAPFHVRLVVNDLLGTTHAHQGRRHARLSQNPGKSNSRGALQVHGRYALAVDDGNAYLAAGVAGLGALWLPEYMAKPHLANGELLPLFDGWHFDPLPIYVAYPPNRHVSAKLRVFIDWVVALMEQKAPVAYRRRSAGNEQLF